MCKYANCLKHLANQRGFKFLDKG